jgi:glycerophosphoryl diester phosphodiesterase
VKKYVIWLFGVSFFLVSCSRWQPLYKSQSTSFMVQAHAHNDYQHARPLQDALDHGFGSVEADIHLVNGQLYVAHDRKGIQPERTLQALYLDPLAARIKERRGFVYEKKKPIFLFIDIKTDADSTYEVLDKVLQDYKSTLTRFDRGKIKRKAVTVILSGNRPAAAMLNDHSRYAGYDGRLEDLRQGNQDGSIPMISDKWSNHFSWYGQGAMPIHEKAKLDSIVRQAHRQKQWIRFWATDVRPPSAQQNLWAELRRAGVDLINTDKLEDLANELGYSSRVERSPSGKP